MGEQIVLSGATVAKIVGVLVVGLFATCLVVSAPERGCWSRATPEQRALATATDEHHRKAAEAAAAAKREQEDEATRRRSMSVSERATAWTAAIDAARSQQEVDEAREKYEGTAPSDQLADKALAVARKRHDQKVKALEKEATIAAKRRAADDKRAAEQIRKTYAADYELYLLRKGIEATVRADGKTLRLKVAMCGRPLVQQMYDAAGPLLTNMGFTRLVCSDGFGSSTSMDL